MIRRLDVTEHAAFEPADDAPASKRAAAEQIRSWLDVLSRLLPVREAERAAIRDELAEHLHERVRDLMVGGRAESEAVGLAIEELGEAAELARRYQCAGRTRTRRIMMNLTMIGVGAGVVLAGVVTLNPRGSNLQPVAYQAPAAPDDSVLEQIRIDMKVGMTMDDLVRAVIDGRKLGVSVDWGVMEEIGLPHEAVLGISGQAVPLSRVLETLGDHTDGWLGWRVEGGEMLRLNTTEHFDRRERTLMVYDVRHVVETVASHEGLESSDASERISEVILAFVEPESWEEAGGMLARHQFIGGKLFVEAPPRMHEKVRWVLEQIASDAELDVRGRAQRSADGEGVLLDLEPGLRREDGGAR